MKSSGNNGLKFFFLLSIKGLQDQIARNKTQDKYLYHQADLLACQRRNKASSTLKKLTPELITQITSRLLEDWSPEQIAGRLKREGRLMSISTLIPPPIGGLIPPLKTAKNHIKLSSIFV